MWSLQAGSPEDEELDYTVCSWLPSAVPYVVLLQVFLLVGLRVLQVLVDGSDLSLLVVDGLVQRLELLLDPLVSLLLGGELTAAALLGVQVGPLLGGLGQPGGSDSEATSSHKLPPPGAQTSGLTDDF